MPRTEVAATDIELHSHHGTLRNVVPETLARGNGLHTLPAADHHLRRSCLRGILQGQRCKVH